MSSSICCFLTFIQISQEAGKVVWYSHLLNIVPQFVVIHTVKGFSVVNADVFSCFFYDPVDIGSLVSASSSFSKSRLSICSSLFIDCWSLGWRTFSITLLVFEISAIVNAAFLKMNIVHFNLVVKFSSTTFFMPSYYFFISYYKTYSVASSLSTIIPDFFLY